MKDYEFKEQSFIYSTLICRIFYLHGNIWENFHWAQECMFDKISKRVCLHVYLLLVPESDQLRRLFPFWAWPHIKCTAEVAVSEDGSFDLEFS